MNAQYDGAASDAVQALYDNPSLITLADRVEEMLNLLEEEPTHKLLRRNRMHRPALWRVTVLGSDEAFTFLWDFEGEIPWVRWAGMGTI